MGKLADRTAAVCPAKHDMRLSTLASGWACDECQESSEKHYQHFRCTEGCDYDLCESCVAKGSGSISNAAQRQEKIQKKMDLEKELQALLRSHRRKLSMALMLRHISGKRDFDLFATPVTPNRFFSKGDL